MQTDFPFPPTSGGRVRSYQILKSLAATNRITLLSFANRYTSESDIDQLRQFCSEVRVVRFEPKHSVFLLLQSLVRRVPYKVLQHASSEFSIAVRQLLDQTSFDVIFSEHPYLAQYLPTSAKNVIPQNIEMMATIFRRTAQSGNLLNRMYAATQAGIMWNYEIDLYRRYGVFIALNRSEQQVIESALPEVTTFLVPNGVDADFFAPDPVPHDAKQAMLVFTGLLSYYPNEQAALFFVREILPLIRKNIPAVGFTIVGKDPPQSVQALADDAAITVTGYVDDVRPYLRDASVVVAPLLIGAGTRLKILEAMASGKAVVSTTIGCEGLDVEDGRDILIADSPTDFADAVCGLLRDSNRAHEIGARARTLVERQYRWQSIGDRLSRFLQDFVATRRGKVQGRKIKN